MAVGHVRYSITGGDRRENAQPLTLNYVKGTLAVAHNGNLVNVGPEAHRRPGSLGVSSPVYGQKKGRNHFCL